MIVRPRFPQAMNMQSELAGWMLMKVRGHGSAVGARHAVPLQRRRHHAESVDIFHICARTFRCSREIRVPPAKV